MTATLDPMEQALIAGYQRQAAQYDHALHLIADAARDAGWVQDVHAALQAVAAFDAELAQTKAAWRATGKTAGPELQALLDRVATQIRTLSAHIDNEVAELSARKQRLLPEIDDFIRQRRTLSAYGKMA